MKLKQLQLATETPPLGERSPNIVLADPVTGETRQGKPAMPDTTDYARSLLFPADAEEIDDDDPRLFSIRRHPDDSCNVVRTKIRRWIQSGAQTVAEFQRTIAVTPESYSAFMALTGTYSGQQSDMYLKASLFFRKRQMLNLPLQLPKVKQGKSTAGAVQDKQKKPANNASNGKSKEMEKLLDTGDYILPGEEEGDVLIFETPREVRRKMRALMAKGVTQAAFARALSEMLPESAGTLSPQTMKAFLSQKGVMDGNTSKAFYCGYVFFEKQRLRDNKPMSKHREAMEDLHPTGVNVTHNLKTTSFIVSSATRQISYDQYGVMHSSRY